jgi:hypothetical protein
MYSNSGFNLLTKKDNSETEIGISAIVATISIANQRCVEYQYQGD